MRRRYLLRIVFPVKAGLILFLNTAATQTAPPVWADTLVAARLTAETRAFFSDGRHGEALVASKKALDIYAGLYGGQHVITADAGMFVARELRYLNRSQESLPLYRQYLQVFEAAGDTLRLARCLHHLALGLRDLSHFAEAHQTLQNGIRLLQPDSAAQAAGLADMYVTLGSVYHAEKNYRAAIRVIEPARAVFASREIPRSLGMACYHLGGAWFGLHDYVRAKEQYLAALANLKPLLHPTHPYFADLYVKVGSCCQKTGEPGLGLAHLLDARDQYLKHGAENPDYIQFLQYLGQFYLEERQYPEAIGQFEACIAAKTKRYGAQSPQLMATWLYLGEARGQAGQFEPAEACFRRGLQIIADSLGGNPQLRYRFYGKLAALPFARGDYAGSARLCDTAFALAGFEPAQPEKMLPRDWFREICQLYARSLAGRYRLTGDLSLLIRAEQFFTLAGQTLYREVEEISVNSSREIFYDRDYPALAQWLDARMQLYAATHDPAHAETAFQIASQSKAFLLAETMRQSGALQYAGVPDSILQAEAALRERIAGAEKALDKYPGAAGVTIDSLRLRLNGDLLNWRLAYDALLRRIEAGYPDYFRLRVLRHETPTTGLRHRLAPDQAILLYNLTAPGSGYAFVLTRDTFCALALRPDEALDEAIQSFRTSLTAYYAAADPGDALYDRSLEQLVALAQSLYRQLVLPVAPLLPGRVILIPDGKLWYLPFEALLTGPPADVGNFRTFPFWSGQKALCYALSTDFLFEPAQPTGRKSEKTWLGIAPFAGNPHVANPVPPRASNDQYISLPYSGAEVRAIASLLRGDAWLDTDARADRFRREAGRYRILHLATHSCADDRQGDYSYLLPERAGESLPAKDLYQFALAADMAVLSACEAGSGRLLQGEGIIGLVRAFTYAGARSVVASQWVAHDQSTADLMVGFYRHLRRGMPKDLALQQARLELFQKTPAQAHPFFWAGFRVYGDVGALW
jgi:CHAT domain-containing protein/Tfp pilus assembly protein PilF